MKRIVFILALCLSVRCFATISLIQSRDGGSVTATLSGTNNITTSAVGFASPTTPGSLLVCLVQLVESTAAQPQGSLSNLPVTSGFTWSQVTAAFGWLNAGNTAGGYLAMYYIPNAAAMSGTTTVTAHVTTSGTWTANLEFSLYEFSGIVTSSPVATFARNQFCSGNVSCSPTGSPTTLPDPGSITTSTTTDLLLVFFSGNPSGGSSCIAGSGYSLGVDASVATIGQAQYQLNVVPGTNATAFSTCTVPEWGALAVAFKGAASVVAVPRHRGSIF